MTWTSIGAVRCTTVATVTGAIGGPVAATGALAEQPVSRAAARTASDAAAIRRYFKLLIISKSGDRSLGRFTVNIEKALVGARRLPTCACRRDDRTATLFGG